jgi:drug/metabolite transporter (DMT)-like permease
VTRRPDLGRLASRAEYRFGLVLLLLLATFTFLAAGLTGTWTGVVAVLLQGATLIAALSAAQVPRGLVRVAALVTLVALVVAATAPTSGAEPNGLVALLSALLVGLAPVAIAWSIVRRRRVDVQTVLGALCIYVLLGMFWAFSFAAIGAFGSGPFFAQEASPTSASYLYFAYVTMTTVGYGDLTARGNLGRSVAVLDALLGQIYLVTVVALLVSQLRTRLTDDIEG